MPDISKRYEIRIPLVDIGIHGDVVYSTDTLEDAERMRGVFWARGTDGLFIVEIDVPQWPATPR